MACNDVDLSAVNQTIGGTFDSIFCFDDWVQDNDFSEIKHLLIKHSLNRIDSLSLTSSEYLQFICDDQLLRTKSHFIPKMVKAIQLLNKDIGDQSLKEFIVISEAEQSVIKTLKVNIKELNLMEKRVNELNLKYPKSIRRINDERDKQIEAAQETIKEIFANIKKSLHMRQKYLFNKLEIIKLDVNNDECKEIDLLKDTTNAIEAQRKKINVHLKQCNDILITHKNENIEKRKERILNIWRQHNDEFNKEILNIQKTCTTLQKLISQNDEYHITIGCNTNKSKYNALLNRINSFGAITRDTTNNSSVSSPKNEENQGHEGDDASVVLIKQLKEAQDIYEDATRKYQLRLNGLMEKNKKYYNDNTSLKYQINTLQQKYEALKQQSITLQQEQKTKYNGQNASLQQKVNTLQELYDNVAHTYLSKYDKLKEENKIKINRLKKENKEEINKLKKENKEETNKLHYTLSESLRFTLSSQCKWYNNSEQKEECIRIVKMMDSRFGQCTSSDGVLKSNCKMTVIPHNKNKVESVAILRREYESMAKRLNWKCYDHWDATCKSKDIVINDDYIFNTCHGYRSVFGVRICVSPYKYHWQIKQTVDSTDDFYIGIVQNGAEIKENYFCSSSTSYAFSGYHAQLYAKGKWGIKYGKCCYEKDAVIDVYLDLRTRVLWYGINGKQYGTAYSISQGRYKLAVCIYGNRPLKLVFSTKC